MIRYNFSSIRRLLDISTFILFQLDRITYLQHYLSFSSNNLTKSRGKFCFRKKLVEITSTSYAFPTHLWNTPWNTTCRQRLPRPGVLVCFYFAESRKSLPPPLVLLEKFPRFRRQNRSPPPSPSSPPLGDFPYCVCGQRTAGRIKPENLCSLALWDSSVLFGRIECCFPRLYNNRGRDDARFE